MRDSPSVEASTPERTNWIEGVAGSKRVIGEPNRSSKRRSFTRVGLNSVFSAAWIKYPRRRNVRAALGSVFTPTLYCGFVLMKLSKLNRLLSVLRLLCL